MKEAKRPKKRKLPEEKIEINKETENEKLEKKKKEKLLQKEANIISAKELIRSLNESHSELSQSNLHDKISRALHISRKLSKILEEIEQVTRDHKEATSSFSSDVKKEESTNTISLKKIVTSSYPAEQLDLIVKTLSYSLKF